MTIYSIPFPRLPRGLHVRALADNLKLYSDTEISMIKQQFTENGRYRYVVNAEGKREKLKYPVYVYEGRYYAVYPGKKYLLAHGDNSFSRNKLTQNLDTGEWLVDKTIVIDEENNNLVFADVINERNILLQQQQLEISDRGDPMSFYRPAVNQVHDEDGKHDLFMPYVHGMDLQEWLDTHPVMPLIMKMNMSFGLLRALENVHASGALHRDVKLRNAIFDNSKPADESVRLVDFGLAINMDELHDELIAGWGTPGYMAPEICASEERENGAYSVKSDIYALGVTLGRVWGLIDIDDAGVMTINDGEHFTGDFALKRCLLRLLRSATHKDPDQRPALDELVYEFSKLRTLLPEEFCVMQTAYIDVNELMQAYKSGERAWDHAIARLSCFDQVQLFTLVRDADTENFRKILTIRQALINRGVIVADQLYQGSRNELAAYARAVNEASLHPDRIVEQAKMVTLQKPEQDERVVMSESQPQPEVETYSWSDWFSWMFGNLSQDAGAAARQVLQPMVRECSPGCFGFFGRSSRESIMTAVPANRIGYYPLEDSDEELSSSSQMRSHY